MEKKKSKQGKFLKAFLKKENSVGSIAPSSKFLVNKICNKIDFSTSSVIVELGPGTGVFTEELLKRAKKDSHIILFELNQDFYKLLKRKFKDKRLHIYKENAENIQEVLNKLGIEQVDVIVSSLPLSILPDSVKNNIIEKCHFLLKKKGLFLQYQYSLSAKNYLKSKFKSFHLYFTALNIPPAFIYACEK